MCAECRTRDAERAVTLYRQKYAEGGMFEAKVYPGMVDFAEKTG